MIRHPLFYTNYVFHKFLNLVCFTGPRRNTELSFSYGNSSCVERYGERHQRYPALNHMCNQYKRWARQSWAGDVTRRLKSKWGATGVSFLPFSKALCVCVSHDLCSVSLIYCCLSCYKSSNIESSHMSKLRQRQRNIGESRSRYRLCV